MNPEVWEVYVPTPFDSCITVEPYDNIIVEVAFPNILTINQRDTSASLRFLLLWVKFSEYFPNLIVKLSMIAVIS